MIFCVSAQFKALDAGERPISCHLKLFKARKECGPLKSRILRVLLTMKTLRVLSAGDRGGGLPGRAPSALIGWISSGRLFQVKCLRSVLGLIEKDAHGFNLIQCYKIILFGLLKE